MSHANAQRSSQQAPSIRYRRASLLDAPLIFDLVTEGAVSGAFSESFIQGSGCATLLWRIVRSVFAQRFQSQHTPSRYDWTIMVDPQGRDLGFFKRSRDRQDCNLELLAVAPAFRNRGVATAVVQAVTGELPPGGRLTVHCTKYARAMQHILKKSRFKRNVRFGMPQVEEYTARTALTSLWRHPARLR